MRQENKEILREKLLENWKAATWKYKKCLKNDSNTQHNKTGGCSSLRISSTATLAIRISIIGSRVISQKIY
jgi:hypothetical protein